MQRLSRIFAILILAFLPAHPAPAKIVYVAQNATGDGSGSSWDNACATITAGLAASASGDEIWVRSATYPEAIEMKEGVALYGGFPVDGSPSFEQRDWRANKTIIDATGLNTHVVVGADFATLDGFMLTGGTASNGGGVYCIGSSLSLINCTFHRNRSAGYGGGLYFEDSSTVLRSCVVSQNQAGYMGGGIHCRDSSLTMLNCLITQNQAELFGGAAELSASTSCLINCSVVGNWDRPGNYGGIDASVWPVIMTNCILSNEGREVKADRLNSDVTYCFVEDGFPGEGNFGGDPLFVSPETGDYRLQNGSPCIDRGLTSAAPDVDIDGNPRPGGDGTVDMGAYESPDEYAPTPPTIYHVRSDASEGGDGLSWETAVRTIQEGLDTAAPLDEVWVAEGVYREGPWLQLATDVSLYGGFQGTETDRGERDWMTHSVRIKSISEGERNLLVRGAVQGLLDGFVIEGKVYCREGTSLTMRNCKTVKDISGYLGNVQAVSGGLVRVINCEIESQSMEGGVYCYSGSYAHLTGCRITSSRGNGVYLRDGSSAKLEDCEVTNCATKGVDLRDNSAATLNNCTITGNGEEGVYSTLGCSVTLENCKITNNGGHGLSKYKTHDTLASDFVRHDCQGYYTSSLTNCLIAQNGGYGLYVSVDPVLVNCTIADNSLGGIFSERKNYTPMYGSSFWECDRLPVMSNCIIWGENATETLLKYYQEYYDLDDLYYYELDHVETPPRGEGLTLSYSCVNGGWPDVGNTDANPLFVDPSSGDYHLQAGSPCIDSGSNEAAQDILLDLDGRIRLWNGRVDMGAYEFGSWTPEGLRCDLNGDGRIDPLDLFLFHQSWHKSVTPIPTP